LAADRVPSTIHRPPSTHILASLVVWLFVTTSPLLAGSSNSLMDISSDGRYLACSNRDSGTVTVVDLTAGKKLHEVRVGSKPEGVSFLGSGHTLAVAAYADDKVVFVNAASGERTGETEVFDEPYGVVSNRDGSKLFVTLDYPGQVVEIDAVSRKVVRTFGAGKFVRGAAISSDDTRLFVTEYYTGSIVAFDLASGKQVDSWPGTGNDNLARQIMLHPSRSKAYLPHIRSRVTAVHGEGSIFPYVSIIDTGTGEGTRRKRVPMDAFIGNRVTANPWEGAVSPDGKQFYVVFAGTDDMYACTVVDDDYREIAYRATLQLGKNPRAVRVAPDNKTVYVYNALGFEVVAYDTANLRPVAKWSVTDNPLGDEILRGKILFYSALQPMVGQRWISCSSCHPDGDPDGRTWHNPEGLRNTQWLAGMAWTHPIHWSADRDEVQDFEHTIRGKLMQGRGLIAGPVQKELGPPNRGLSADLDAMAAYSNSHHFPISPHAKGGLSAAAKRGRDVFLSKETRCAECHSGPVFTDSRPGEKFTMHDVGTSHDDKSEKLGPVYDTPTLLGVYRTAPYLHHGKAETLADVLTKLNRDDRHGKTSQLSAAQIADLVEFLKALPYEDPEPAAKAAGLVEVRK
jgi:DNA-binding beta-propeller fold protein YncE/cytochrome c553